KVCWPALLLALSGCAISSGFSRDMLQARLREDAVQVTDEEVRDVRALRPQLRFPCRVAVALRGEGGEWRWTFGDKKAMQAWGDALCREGVASDVIFMSGMFARGECSLKDLRASAAKYGADALLLLKGTAATESRYNPLAVFNVTVLGGF